MCKLDVDFNDDGNVNGDDGAIPLPQKSNFGEWGTVMAFSFLTILVLYTFYIFHKGKSKDKFPSDKSIYGQGVISAVDVTVIIPLTVMHPLNEP